jgi:predicted flap endonuclease-1-like 5' DNA nuclease
VASKNNDMLAVEAGAEPRHPGAGNAHAGDEQDEHRDAGDVEEELDASDLEIIGAPDAVPVRASSAPPPVPRDTRPSERPTLRPSVPPPQSGIWRIPPTPPLAGGTPAMAPPPEPAELRRERELFARRTREQKAENDRLRLAVTLREDRIRELELALSDACERATELERRVERLQRSIPPDDLKRISGIGPAFERALHAQGITRFAEIARWSNEDVQRVAEALGIPPQRIERDGWVESARELAT